MNATQRLFVASCLSIMVTSMIFSIRADILQPVAADYGLNNALIGLTMSSVFWGFTLGILVCGLIVDVVGMKRLHLLSGAGYLGGIALILLAPVPAAANPDGGLFASTGSTVQTVALTSDSHCTGAGACHSSGSGWVTAKCSSTSTLATQLA